MNINIKHILFLSFALFLTSCYKDSLTEGQGETILPSPDITMSVNGDVIGYVYDELKLAVEGANVSLKGNTATTDEFGVFKFRNIELNPNGSYIKVQKQGYMLGSDMIYGFEGIQHTSRISLLQLDGEEKFSSSTGGKINVEGGGQIDFSSNSIVTPDGASYSGEVSVSARRISTGDPLIADKMPGALVALDAEGRTVALGSMGMIAVELRDDNGNELNLKEGSTAEVSFPILAQQQKDAPSQIKLWSFDEENGIWKEEGVANRDGESYIAQVSHFSFWNCDAPFPLITVCGKVIYENGTPAAQIQISIVTDGFGTGYGWTNADGSFSGKVPLDQVLNIRVHNTLCNYDDAITVIEVGPFSNKTTLDDIIIPVPNEISFDGKVLCSGDPIPNALVVYAFDGNSYAIESDENGIFNLYINDACGEVSSVDIFAVDPSTGTGSLTTTIDAGSASNLELEICNDCSFTVTIDRDPTSDLCLERKIQAFVEGNGNYAYLWTDGSSQETIQISNSGLYCVTVTETDLACSMVVCSNEAGFTVLGGGLESRASCDADQGTIYSYFYGGTPPYDYAWSDPSITSQEDSLGIEVPPGTYSVTITDSQGCTFEAQTEVEAVTGFLVDLEAVSDCYGATIEVIITGGQAPYTYVWPAGTQGQNNILYVWQDGNYCVDVYDSNGCKVTQCIDVVIEDITGLVQVDVSNCVGGLYTLTNNSGIDADITLWYNNNNYTASNGQSIDIDFIAGGFGDLWYFGYSPSLGCEFEGNSILLPYLFNQDSLSNSYQITQKSCPTCDDGGVALNNNYLSYTSFNGATAGSILILDANYNDVTATATGNMLGSGTYYVVVTDVVSGCYIYSEKILIT